MTYLDIDEDTLARAEREAMERPSNSAMWDERLYNTHAPVMSWAERGDDIAEESNYRSALRIITETAGKDVDDHVIDATISDWLVGSLRQIFVQVRDADGSFTPAWREAVNIALGLQDYPLVDDADYSDREHAEYERQYADAIGDARNDYENACYDADRESDIPTDAMHARAVESLDDSDDDFHSEYRHQDCDYAVVSKAYASAIDAMRPAEHSTP